MKTQISLLALGAACLATAACSTGGGGARTPDEFRVVTKAPLTVPPDYSLRPPEPGGSVPAEVEAARAENASAFGTSVGADASASEKALVAAAGANAVSPLVRVEVDYDETKAIRKSKTVADRILFMDEGQILEDTDPDSFFSNPKTARAKDFLGKILAH